MKLFFVASTLLLAAAVRGQDEEAKVGLPNPEVACFKINKCGINSPPVLGYDDCQCTVFPNICGLESYNAYSGPDYKTLSERGAGSCSCYTSTRWLDNPVSDNCRYVARTRIPAACALTDCIPDDYKPVTASNGCECRIFKNECTLKKFNCNYVLSPSLEPFTITDQLCPCKYNGLVIGGPVLID